MGQHGDHAAGRSAVGGVSEAAKIDPADGGLLAETGMYATGFGALVRADGRDLLAVPVGGKLVYFDPDTLKPLHSGPMLGSGVPLSVDLDGDGAEEVVVGGHPEAPAARGLLVQDPRTGAERWSSIVSRTPNSAVAVLDGLLWIAGPNSIGGLDARTGEHRADIGIPGPVCSVVAWRGSLAFGTARGRLGLATPPRGGAPASFAWSVETGLDIVAYTPVVAGEALVALSKDGTVVAHALADGRRLWRHEFRARVEAGLAARDLDADGAPEIAVALQPGLVAVLDGKTGRVRWRSRPGGQFGPILPFWADVDRDGRPEILLSTQRPHAYALRVTLDPLTPAAWPSYRMRAESMAREAALDLALRDRIHEAERTGRDADVLETARATPTAWSCWRAAFAADRLGDDDAARDFASRAVARGARRLDLDWLLARRSRDEAAFVLALRRARPVELAALMPAGDEDLWKRCCLAAARECASSGDDERAVLLFHAAGDPATALDLLVGRHAADPGPLFLAHARGLLRAERYEDAFSALRDAARFASTRADADEILSSLDRDGRSLRQRAADLRATGRAREAIPHLERAVRLLPGRPGPLRDLASALLEAPDATADEKRRALGHARGSLAFLEEQSPADQFSRAAVLETLAAAHFACGDAAEAVRVLKEAIGLTASPQARSPLEARLAEYEKAAPER